MQEIITAPDCHRKLQALLDQLCIKKYLLVCDSSFSHLSIRDWFVKGTVPHIVFNGFTSNPLYEDVRQGVKLFNAEHCDAIVAVGGGSAIDVAKCIKLYCRMDSTVNYLRQEYRDSGIPLVALPTTAGTGSESTKYAVIYFEGQKQSVTHESILPDYVVLEPETLITLPTYQKKCTMLDALCQSIESWWSVNSTEESRDYAGKAISIILTYKDEYFRHQSPEACGQMLFAANYAGRAINITQTTAAHAMSYKLTSLYKLPHGHAVAICLPEIWEYMSGHLEQCVDSRGQKYVQKTFRDISEALGAATIMEGVIWFRELLNQLGIILPRTDNPVDYEILAQSVNPVRLKNNPVALTEQVLKELYQKIVVEGSH